MDMAIGCDPIVLGRLVLPKAHIWPDAQPSASSLLPLTSIHATSHSLSGRPQVWGHVNVLDQYPLRPWYRGIPTGARPTQPDPQPCPPQGSNLVTPNCAILWMSVLTEGVD